MLNTKYFVVGAGIFGSVIAERIATVLGESVTLIERRNHIGGNCYSTVDPETGIECHRYGSHIFHTSSKEVWDYMAGFCSFTGYRHKVLAISQGKIYNLPINLKTLCDMQQRYITPTEARKLLSAEQSDPMLAKNLEEKAIALIGKDLYEKFIHGYTEKQWEKSPRELPSDIISRLPVRTDFNTDYFNDPYQGVPKDGYFKLFENLLSNPRIKVMLYTDYQSIRNEIPSDATIVYTGMIDEFFGYRFGELEWRSLRFEWETLDQADFQGTTVINYVDAEIPYTRIHEFKHYHPERRPPFELGKTVICREYSRTWSRGLEAYYPVNTARNQSLLKQYQELAEKTRNVIFGGRLGCYRYWDMDKAVLAALICFENQIKERSHE